VSPTPSGLDGRDRLLVERDARFDSQVVQEVLRVLHVVVQAKWRLAALEVTTEPGSRPARRAAPSGPKGLDAGGAEPATHPTMNAVGSLAADLDADPQRFAPSGRLFLRHSVGGEAVRR
jgi:hypothetical protein